MFLKILTNKALIGFTSADESSLHTVVLILFSYSIAEYIEEKKPLGGLLLLLPQVFNPQNIDSKDEAGHDSAVGIIKGVLLELERLLVHANIPVSE